MIVSLKWLQDYVNIPLSLDDLVDRLTMSGLEVESVLRRGESLEGVVTARLDEILRHPKADRLHLCKVFDGEKTVQVVCGAPNLVEGSIVPLAVPGATLPSGLTLEEARIRGELSQGMLCSQKELELGEDASGIWLLGQETPVGLPLCNALGVDDVILEIGITPNRGDCLSMTGIAREVAAVCGTSLHYPETGLESGEGEEGPSVAELASVTIEDPVGCPRYAARLVEGVRIGPSPDWLCRRLEAVGLRSINNVVDITNFILMELGQPLHAFDFDRLGEHRIVVRRAEAGERFRTLDGVERVLFDDTLLICDGNGPVAIAGIMGGESSEITPETTRVLIESAHFQPQCIRRSSKKLGMRTESSFRFERHVDPQGVIRAVDRAARLMRDLGGGRIAPGRIDVYPEPAEPSTLSLRVDRTNRFLGTRIEVSEMERVLGSIEMDVQRVEDNLLRVKPPSFRPDIEREVDLTEEVARLAGYDRIPITYPTAMVHSMPDDPHRRLREELKSTLTSYGFFEILTYSFISLQSLQKLRLPPEDPRLRPVGVMNPLSEEQAVMRTSLIPGLLQTVAYNLDRQNENLRLFELSRVFLPQAGEPLPRERFHVAGAVTGKRNANLLYGSGEELGYVDVKGVTEGLLGVFHLGGAETVSEHLPPYMDPLGAASVLVEGEAVGIIGKLHPEVETAFDFKQPVWIFELDFETLFGLKRPAPLFRPLPRFPGVDRDIALVVDEDVPVQEPLRFILHQKEPLLESVEIFDLYQSRRLGEGKKSAGYRLTYRAPDRSLTDQEVNEVHERLVKKVLKAFDATLR